MTKPSTKVPASDSSGNAAVREPRKVEVAAHAVGVALDKVLATAQAGSLPLLVLRARFVRPRNLRPLFDPERTAWWLEGCHRVVGEGDSAALEKVEGRSRTTSIDGVDFDFARVEAIATGDDLRLLASNRDATVTVTRLVAVLDQPWVQHRGTPGEVWSTLAWHGELELRLTDLWVMPDDLNAVLVEDASQSRGEMKATGPTLTEGGRESLQRMLGALARLIAKDNPPEGDEPAFYGTEDDPNVNAIVQAALGSGPQAIDAKHFAEQVNAGLVAITGKPRKRGKKPEEQRLTAPRHGKAGKRSTGKSETH